MTPNESLAAFTAFAASHGVALTASLPREGLGQMLSFFQSAAAPRCKGPDSDMLLYQWGAYDWGKGLYFELNITRQFIENDLQDDDAISQLSLTYKFEPTPERWLWVMGIAGAIATENWRHLKSSSSLHHASSLWRALRLSRSSSPTPMCSQRPNPSLQPQCYSRLRPLPRSGELKR